MDAIDIIINLLQKREISGAQMSRDLGFSNAVFTQWKQRKQKPSLEKLQKMADYFGVSTDYILGKSEFQNINEMNDYISSEKGLVDQLNSLDIDTKNTLVSMLTVIIHNYQVNTLSVANNFEAINFFINLLEHHSRMIEVIGSVIQGAQEYSDHSSDTLLNIYQKILAITAYRDESIKVINAQCEKYINEVYTALGEPPMYTTTKLEKDGVDNAEK